VLVEDRLRDVAVGDAVERRALDRVIREHHSDRRSHDRAANGGDSITWVAARNGGAPESRVAESPLSARNPHGLKRRTQPGRTLGPRDEIRSPARHAAKQETAQPCGFVFARDRV
jgi:hypothetical protein